MGALVAGLGFVGEIGLKRGHLILDGGQLFRGDVAGAAEGLEESFGCREFMGAQNRLSPIVSGPADGSITRLRAQAGPRAPTAVVGRRGQGVEMRRTAKKTAPGVERRVPVQSLESVVARTGSPSGSQVVDPRFSVWTTW